MTFLSRMNEHIDRLADNYMQRVLAHQETEIQDILEEALMSGLIRGEAVVVMTYQAGRFPRLRARLA